MSSPLSPDQWRQFESFVDALLDTPPERRAALYAEISGGDPARRAELERLVAACERRYPLLDEPAAQRFAALTDTSPVTVPEVLAGRYRIARELGRGGMATVYLARDLKHDRDVAVKVVRGELAAALGSGRFAREIGIAARLRHPNIVPLYDSGEIEGVLYYVMPYERGSSLRERLRREGSLPLGDTITILRDVCDALAHAHEHGVVHRDMKPDNILLSGRHALVTDFGVAKAIGEAGATADRRDRPGGPAASAPGIGVPATVTSIGFALGTPGYMAPEQVSGDPHVDHRADIYAIGVLGYEMLTGNPPFTGPSAREILVAQLTQALTPVTAYRPEVPPALAVLIMRCLEKRPGDRYQRAGDLVQHLQALAVAVGPSRPLPSTRTQVMRRWGRGTVGVVLAALGASLWARGSPPGPSPEEDPAPPSLAVLVFQHGGQTELESLAVALTGSLIGSLGDVPGLNVRSLRAVWPYRDASLTLDSVARALDVPWVVGGRVDRVGGEVVASVELTDAASGRLLARRSAAAVRGNDLALVEAIVAQVAVMLRERIGDRVRTERWRAGTRSAAAFAAVTRADRDLRDADALMADDLPGARRRLRRADSTLEVASRADPAWVEPHVQRAWIARTLASAFGPGGLGADSFASALGTGIGHAEAALRAHANHPRALEVRGVLLHDASLLAPGDSAARLLAAAERSLTDATNADSTLARALNALSAIHVSRGELELARVMAARAYAADAYSEDAQQVLGRLFHIDFDDANDADARRWCTAYGRQFPRDWFPGYCRLMLMAWDSTEAPDPADAWRVARDATAAAPDMLRSAIGAQLEMLVAGVLARVGPTSAAERVLEDVHAAMARDSAIAREPFGSELLQLEAGVRARLGQTDQAVALLKAYLSRVPATAAMVARGRRFSNLPSERLTVAGPSTH